MGHTRKRIDRRRGYRHEDAAEEHARAMRASARATENVVVNVHVHNEIATPEEPGASKRRAKKATLRRVPAFSGTLYSWKEHYLPIVKRLAPVVAEREKSTRGASRLRRFCLLAALAAAVVAVGCGLL